MFSPSFLVYIMYQEIPWFRISYNESMFAEKVLVRGIFSKRLLVNMAKEKE